MINLGCFLDLIKIIELIAQLTFSKYLFIENFPVRRVVFCHFLLLLDVIQLLSRKRGVIFSERMFGYIGGLNGSVNFIL